MEMFSTLQKAWPHIATAHGESQSRYGRDRPTTLQGAGQGNGAGSTIWAAISVVLIAIMCRYGHGISIISPITCIALNVVCFAFVDGTDVVQGGKNVYSTGKEVLQEMQEVVNWWENSIRAMGGALVPAKSYWYLIGFQWANGVWKYRPRTLLPGNITI